MSKSKYLNLSCIYDDLSEDQKRDADWTALRNACRVDMNQLHEEEQKNNLHTVVDSVNYHVKHKTREQLVKIINDRTFDMCYQLRSDDVQLDSGHEYALECYMEKVYRCKFKITYKSNTKLLEFKNISDHSKRVFSLNKEVTSEECMANIVEYSDTFSSTASTKNQKKPTNHHTTLTNNSHQPGAVPKNANASVNNSKSNGNSKPNGKPKGTPKGSSRYGAFIDAMSGSSLGDD